MVAPYESYTGMKKQLIITFFSIILFSGSVCASDDPSISNENGKLTENEKRSDAKFVVIPLGTKGGLVESNLSSYLVSPLGDTNFIAFDAGTVMTGLKQAKRKGSLQGIVIPKDSPLSLEGTVMVHHIKAYAISHAHIDHVAGMVISAPYDSPKAILGLRTTIDNIRDHLFNWKIWPNFGDDGQTPLLKKYHYVGLTPGQGYSVVNTAMNVTAFELSHSGKYISTAFLVESGGQYLLYFGDAGADSIEESDKMKQIWAAVAPLVRNKVLRGIFLEISFPNEHPDTLLFGHLTPKLMMQELHTLARLVNPNQPEIALQNLKVLVTHIKPSINRNEKPEQTIMSELNGLNNLGVKFILPETGERILF